MDISLKEYENFDPKCTIEVEDKKITFQTPNRLTRWRVDTLLTKEPHTIDWLNEIGPKETLLDIGANVGMYSIYAGAVRGATVIALEPESQNYSILNMNIRLNKLDHLIAAYCIGVSDRDTFDYIFMSNLMAGDANHAVGEPLNMDLQSFSKGIEFAQGCITYKIDSLVEDNKLPVPDYVKIDVDGFEHKVVEGAKKTLSNKKVKSVIIEINPKLLEHLAAIELLKNLGFKFSQDQVNKAAEKNKGGIFEGISEYVFRR